MSRNRIESSFGHHHHHSWIDLNQPKKQKKTNIYNESSLKQNNK